jgi:hypothetical protein
MDDMRNESISLVFDLNTAILQKWEKALYWLAEREYCMSKGANVYKEEAIRYMFELFSIIRYSIKNDLREEDYNAIVQAFRSKNVEECILQWEKIDQWLYNKGVTKFDNRIKYERHRVEMANKHKGF